MATSGSGERRARRGLRYQDRASAVLIHTKLADRSLKFVALADDDAGMFDDLVIGCTSGVIAHQYKSSTKPAPIGIKSLLLGAKLVIAECASSYLSLRRAWPGHSIKLKYVTSHYPSTNDKGTFGLVGKSSADLFKALNLHPDRALTEWLASPWAPAIEKLQSASKLNPEDFGKLLTALEFVFNAPSTIDVNEEVDSHLREEVKHIGATLGNIIGLETGKTQWSRHELLKALEWRDQFANHFEHRFPIGQHVQRNETTEQKVREALSGHAQGYVSLVGPPGAGKSTLLERTVFSAPFRKVVRYLAYVPGAAQGLGRGEAVHFFTDLNSQLRSSGLPDLAASNGNLTEAQAKFGRLLTQAGKRFQRSAVETVIIIDGLDHVPREEKPELSFLQVLPLPQSLPDGVIILLGSQRVDLSAMPPAVRQQASEKERQIEMEPLSNLAVEQMIRSIGLQSEVRTDDVWRVSKGHPLVTQYLLALLKDKSQVECEKTLGGEFTYDGDINAVYRSVWEGVTDGQGAVRKMLLVLGHVEGRIEPELLATYLGDEAIEAGFHAASHLLDTRDGRWTPFHNSFRLFLQSQSVMKFGQVDHDFATTAIYTQLAGMALIASASSEQRWLGFRYTLLSEDKNSAREIACRAYFMAQFIAGRNPLDIGRDINDSFACHGADIAPEVLFDLLLAKDELYRRKDAISMSANLVEAQIASGDFDAAEAQLESDHSAGDVYKVIFALLDDGQVDRARRLFDREQPWNNFDDFRGQGWDRLFDWADCATLFLDEELIAQRLDLRPEQPADKALPMGVRSASDIEAQIKLSLVYARIDRDPANDVETLTQGLEINQKERAKLVLRSATGRFDSGDTVGALVSLGHYEELMQGDGALGPSWTLSACRLALDLSETKLAGQLYDLLPQIDLSDLEHQSEQVASRVERLIAYCALTSRLGHTTPKLQTPEQTVYAIMQTHSCEIGTYLGDIAKDKYIDDKLMMSAIDRALSFIGRSYGAHSDSEREVYGVRWGDKRLFEAVCTLITRCPRLVQQFENSVLQHIFPSNGRLAGSFDFRLLFIETLYEVNGDAVRAATQLGEVKSIVTLASSPQEEIDYLAQLAVSYGKIGRSDAARLILTEMRAVSLGVYAAAKKDGQYQVWSEFLITANHADPNGAASRSLEVLRLLTGVYDSDGDDQATRAGKEVLVEALASSNDSQSHSVFEWVYENRFFDWTDLVDAQCRALLRRRPALAVSVAITWTCLCLPYYREVYNSLTDTGAFLKELVELAPISARDAALDVIVAGLQRDAMPESRNALLRVLRDALKAHSQNTASLKGVLRRWELETPFDDPDTYNSETLPDYAQIADFQQIDAAVKVEVVRREGHTSTHYGNLVNSTLADQVVKLIASASWNDVLPFANANPELVKMTGIKNAVARAAFNAGNKAYAAELVLPVLEDRNGWGGWSGNGSLRYHQGRHLLGEANAFIEARQDFISNLAVGGIGTGTALWDFKTILQVIYPPQQLKFYEIWKPLGEQIPQYRDYRNTDSIPTHTVHSLAEEDRLTALITRAAKFEISEIREQIRNLAALLLQHSLQGEFATLIRSLLRAGGDIATLAARCMLDTKDDAATLSFSTIELQTMSNNQDAIVAATAQILSQRSEHPIAATSAGLPVMYARAHPPLASETNHTLIHTRTRSPLVDDPGNWSAFLLSNFASISKFSGISIDTLRHRAHDLIKEWGGLERYGATATQALEDEYSRLGLRLTYINPHAGVAIRAARAIIHELLLAGHLGMRDADFLLSRLDGSPLHPPWNMAESRPSSEPWPTLPSNSFISDDENWLEEQSFHRITADTHTLASVSNFNAFRVRTHSEEVSLLWRGTWTPNFDDHAPSKTLIYKLPRTAWLHGKVYKVDETTPTSPLVSRLTTSLFGFRDELLIFSPECAEDLGWYTWNGDPTRYYHPSEGLMVRTQIWRDGWTQPIEHADKHWASGQAIVLSDAGVKAMQKANLYTKPNLLRYRQQKAQDKPRRWAHWNSATG